MLRPTLVLLLSLAAAVGVARAECVAKPFDPAKEPLVTKDNAASYGFKITINEPRTEYDLVGVGVEFPKKFDENYTFGYSKALYTQGGKPQLSFRPTVLDRGPDHDVEYGFAGSAQAISCLVNIYPHNTIHGECGPEKRITIDLRSFLRNPVACERMHPDAFY